MGIWGQIRPTTRRTLSPLAFPLFVGKTWSFDYSNVTNESTGETLPRHVDGNVTGWETLKVPAGTFQCLRVVQKLRRMVHAMDGIFPANDIETYWFAPEVRWHIRRQFEGRDWHGKPADRWSWELLNYGLM